MMGIMFELVPVCLLLVWIRLLFSQILSVAWRAILEIVRESLVKPFVIFL